MHPDEVVAAFRRIETRIDRARRALADLETELARFDEEQRPSVVVLDQHPLFRGTAWKITHLPAPDPEWEHVVGEIAYQIRSSLDHLVALAVEVEGGDRARHRGSFPIALTERDYLRVGRKGGSSYRDIQLAGTSGSFRSLVDAHQPFVRAEPREHPLAILNAVCNGDKHRDAQIAGLALREVTAYVLRGNWLGVFRQTIRTADRAVRGRLLAVGQVVTPPAAMYLESEEFIDSLDPALGELTFPVLMPRVGVCFGTEQVMVFDLRNSLRYVEEQVLPQAKTLLI